MEWCFFLHLRHRLGDLEGAGSSRVLRICLCELAWNNPLRDVSLGKNGNGYGYGHRHGDGHGHGDRHGYGHGYGHVDGDAHGEEDRDVDNGDRDKGR